MTLHVSVAGATDIGRVRTRNEDSFHVDAAAVAAAVAVVADGMGGAPAGDVASSMAVESFIGHLSAATALAAPETEPSLFRSVSNKVADGVRVANEQVSATARTHPDLDGMGCTITALLLDKGTGAYAIAHVGDSRAYRLRGGELRQLTHDHTLVQESVDEGTISPEEAQGHPYGHVLTRVLGSRRTVVPQLIVGTAVVGDVFLLCTDGLLRVLQQSDVVRILTEEGSGLQGMATALVTEANVRGGPDNATAALVVVGASS